MTVDLEKKRLRDAAYKARFRVDKDQDGNEVRLRLVNIPGLYTIPDEWAEVMFKAGVVGGEDQFTDLSRPEKIELIRDHIHKMIEKLLYANTGLTNVQSATVKGNDDDHR